MTARGRHWTLMTIESVALALLAGAEAEIVGETLLRGVPLRYLEIDGVTQALDVVPRQESPAIRVTSPSGFVSLYVMKQKDVAEDILNRAKRLAGTT